MTAIRQPRIYLPLAALAIAVSLVTMVGINQASANRVPAGGSAEGIEGWAMMLTDENGKHDDHGSGSVDPRTLTVLDEQVIDGHLFVVAKGMTSDGEARAVSATFAKHPGHGRWYPLFTTDRPDDGKGWADIYELPNGRSVVAFGDVPKAGLADGRTVADSDLMHVGESLPEGVGIRYLEKDEVEK